MVTDASLPSPEARIGMIRLRDERSPNGVSPALGHQPRES
jgi:hypothetical protein